MLVYSLEDNPFFFVFYYICIILINKDFVKLLYQEHLHTYNMNIGCAVLYGNSHTKLVVYLFNILSSAEFIQLQIILINVKHIEFEN